MIPRRVYTPQGIIACPLQVSRGHKVIPSRVYTPLGVIACPPRLVPDPWDDFSGGIHPPRNHRVPSRVIQDPRDDS